MTHPEFGPNDNANIRDKQRTHSGHLLPEQGGEYPDPQYDNMGPLTQDEVEQRAERLRNAPHTIPPRENRDDVLLGREEPKKSRKGLYGAIAGTAAASLAVGGFYLGSRGSDNEGAPNADPTRPTASAPAVPGQTTPSTGGETSGSAPANETELTPELRALAASVTPEKLATMTPEQLKDAFTINIKDLDPNNIPESYMQRVVVLQNARQQAGMTDGEWQSTNEVSPGYPRAMTDKYFYITTQQLFGKKPTEANPDLFIEFRERYDQQHFAYKNNLVNKDYVLKEELVPNTITINDSGDGVIDPFTVSAITHLYEPNDNSAELDKAIGPGEGNKPVNMRTSLTITGVKADDKGNLYPASTSVEEAR